MVAKINPLSRMFSSKNLSQGSRFADPKMGKTRLDASQEPAYKTSLGSPSFSLLPDTPRSPKQEAIQESAYNQAKDLAEMRAAQVAASQVGKNSKAEFASMDPNPYVQEQKPYINPNKGSGEDYPTTDKYYPTEPEPYREAQKPYINPNKGSGEDLFEDSYLIGPMPRGKFDNSDLQSYLTMGKAAQMGYKKGGAVKAKSNAKSASGKSNGYADKNGRINLGSSRVSTTVKSKKNPNF